MKKNVISMSVLCFFGLSACSHYDYHSLTQQVYGPEGFIHEKPPAYQSAHEVAGLSLPPDLSREMIRPLYAVPPISPSKRVDKATHRNLLLPPGNPLSQKAPVTIAEASDTVVSEKPNFYYTHRDGRVLLVLDKPLAQAWLWLGDNLPKAGLAVVSTIPEKYMYQVRDMMGKSGMYTVHLVARGETQTQVWITENFKRVGSQNRSGFYFERLLKRLKS